MTLRDDGGIPGTAIRGYLRKAWIPPCEMCGKPEIPIESGHRTPSGSWWWVGEFHFGCALKREYGDLVLAERESPLIQFIRGAGGGEQFDGGKFEVPFVRPR